MARKDVEMEAAGPLDTSPAVAAAGPSAAGVPGGTASPAAPQPAPSASPVRRDLFKNVRYWLNPNLGLTRYLLLADLLDSHGAKPADESLPDFRTDDKFAAKFLVRARAFECDPTKVTHIITEDTDFPSFISMKPEAESSMAMVTPLWIEAGIKNGFLHQPQYYSPIAAHFFSGVVVTTTGGITLRDRETLFASVAAHGGQFRDNLTKDVTHLVALQPSGKKYEVATTMTELNIAVVLPQYFDDCAKVRKRLDADLYRFPNPAILQGDPDKFLKIKEQRDENTIATSPVTKRFLEGVRFHLARNLTIARIWTEKLVSAGATIVTQYATDDVDVVIVPFRSGDLWAMAEREGKMVASFEWLKDIFIAEELLRPKARLLHYPPPLPTDRKEIKISVTNYAGRAREDIRRMIHALGFTYTPTFTSANTHLIAAIPKGHKFDKAEAFNVSVVNHLWLEETYAYWKVMALTRSAYVNFPPGIAHTVGDMEVPAEAISKFLESHDSGRQGAVPIEGIVKDSQSQFLKPLGGSQAGGSVAGRSGRKSSQAASQEDHVPVIHVSLGENKTNATGTPVEDSQQQLGSGLRPHAPIVPRENVRDSLEGPGSGSGSVGFRKPASQKPGSQAKGASQPGSPPGVAVAEPLQPENVNTPHGSLGSPLPLAPSAGSRGPGGRKRQRDPMSDAESDREKRRARGSPEPARSENMEGGRNSITPGRKKGVAIVFTGQKPSDGQIKSIKKLGGSVVENVTEATHLVATKVTRTEKLLLSIAHGLHIVKWSWLEASFELGHFADETKHELLDAQSEEMHKYTLSESLRKARTTKLLQGKQVFMTKSCKPEESTVRKLVEASGGQFFLLNTQRRMQNIPKEGIVLSCIEDNAVFPTFEEQGLRVHSTEYLLTGVLRQEIPEDEFLLTL